MKRAGMEEEKGEKKNKGGLRFLRSPVYTQASPCIVLAYTAPHMEISSFSHRPLFRLFIP